MLVIQSDAWHLRVARWGNYGYQPRDLCSYFWHVVGTLAFRFVIIPLWVASGLFLISWFLYALFTRVFYGLLFLGVVVATTVVTLIVLTVITQLASHIHTRERLVPRTKRVNILSEFLKAKKRRICPLIQVEEEG